MQNKIYLVVKQFAEFDRAYRVVDRGQVTKNSALFVASEKALHEEELLYQCGYKNVVIQPENDCIKVIADGTLIFVYHTVELPIV